MQTRLAGILSTAWLLLSTCLPAVAQEAVAGAAKVAAGAPATPPFVVQVETRQWHQGEPPLRLIRKDAGFCALTSVTGHFQGSGEQVRVYVGEDGYWYLGGQSQQQGVAAECVVIGFPATFQAPAKGAPIPASAADLKILAASYSYGGEYADVTARVRELTDADGAFSADPDALLVDPHPGMNKCLVVFCEVKGKRAIFSVGEGEKVSRELLLKNAQPVNEKASNANHD